MKRTMMTMVVAAATVLGACDGGDGATGVKRFAGVWTATSGTVTAVCNGESSSWPLTGTLTWQPGSTSDLLQTTEDGCVIRAEVEATTAVLDDAATCTGSIVDEYGGSVTTVLSINAYTFALSSDGLTAAENLTGTIAATSDSGQSVTCTVTSTASYRKQ